MLPERVCTNMRGLAEENGFTYVSNFEELEEFMQSVRIGAFYFNW